MNPVWRAAREYLEMGWSVIPTRPDKTAIVAWARYQHELPTPSRVDRWFRVSGRCVAVVCGAVSGLVIVDIERPGVHLYRDLPATLMAMSQSGGVHWYYRYPGNDVDLVRVIASTQKDGDLRSDGQYALAPPSVGRNGQYVWMNGEPIAECPKMARRVEPIKPIPTMCSWKLSELSQSRNYPSRSERIMAIARMAVNGGASIEEFEIAVMNDWSGSKLLDKGEYATDYVRHTYDKAMATESAGKRTWATVLSVRHQARTKIGKRIELILRTDDGIDIRQGVTLIDGTERTEALKIVLPGLISGGRIFIELREELWHGNRTWKVGRFLEKE